MTFLRRLPSLRNALLVLSLAAIMAGLVAAQAPVEKKDDKDKQPDIKASTPSTNIASRCATARSSSRPSMCRRTRPRRIRFCSRARLTASGRMVSISTSDDLGPSPLFGKAGYIFVYQDVRGRWMSEGEFVNMRPHNPAKKSRNDIDESSDTYDTIDWLVKHVPNNNGKVGQWGISYPGFYTAAGMIDAHPALKAAVAAGAGHRLVHRRRLAPQRRLVPAAHASTSWPASAGRARSRPRSSPAPSTTTRRTATISS